MCYIYILWLLPVVLNVLWWSFRHYTHYKQFNFLLNCMGFNIVFKAAEWLQGQQYNSADHSGKHSRQAYAIHLHHGK